MAAPPRVYEITFTVPAGTPIANPLSQSWVTEDNTIADIELYVPPGHNGLTGFRVMKGDVQLLPFTKGTFITANDYRRVFDIGAYIPTGDLKLQGYNTGVNPHSFFVRATITTYTAPQSQVNGSPSQVLPADTITVASDPLSPDAILGPDTTAALTAGTITADDLAPLQPPDTSGPQ